MSDSIALWISAMPAVALVVLGLDSYVHGFRLWPWLRRWRLQPPIFLAPTGSTPPKSSLDPLLRRVHSRPDELRDFVAKRLADIPLRQHEIEMVAGVLWWAIYNPVEQFLTGNDAVDIKAKEERRVNTQLWYMPLPMVGAYPRGLESDQTLESLTECHKRLKRLIAEVRFDVPYWMSQSDTRRYS